MRTASPLSPPRRPLRPRGLARRSAPEFRSRNIKVIGISADALQEHYEWIDDIIEIGNKTAPTCVEYPIVRPRVRRPCPRTHRAQIADPDRSISNLYEMLDEQDMTNVSPGGDMCTVRWVSESHDDPLFLNSVQIRTVFFIDPAKIIRAMLLYPASVGRDFDEVIRFAPFVSTVEGHPHVSPGYSIVSP